MTDLSNRTANKIELQLWRNTTASGGTEYNNQCFNGISALITSGAGATQIAWSAVTAQNGLDVATQVYQNLPENVLNKEDLTMFVGYDVFRAIVSSMRNNSYINLFDFSEGGMQQGPASWGVMLPASNVRIVPTQGLTSQNKIVCGPAKNILVGMNAEAYTVKSMYDPFADEIKVNIHATYGVGVAFPDEFVIAA